MAANLAGDFIAPYDTNVVAKLKAAGFVVVGTTTLPEWGIMPTTETARPNLSTEHQRDGDARRPSDTLDKGQPAEETIPRKSSLLGD